MKYILLLIIKALAINPILQNYSNNLTLTYEIAQNQSQIVLYFSEALSLSGQDIQLLVAIYLVDLNEYTFTVEYINNQTYALNLNYQKQFYKTHCTLRFVAPYEIRGANQYLNRQQQTLKFDLGPYITITDTEQTVMLILEIIVYSIMGIGFIMTIGFNFYRNKNISIDIGSTLNLFWLLLDFVQLMNILMYLNTQITPQLRDFLRFLQYFNFTFHLNGFLYNINQQNNNQNLLYTEDVIQPQYIYNTFVQWCLIVFSLLITVVSKLMKQGYFKQLVEYSLILRSIQICLCSLCLFGFIQIQLFSFDSSISIANTVATIVGFIFVFGYYCYFFFILNKTQATIHNKSFRVMFDGLQTKAFFKRNFYLFLEIRKLIYTSTVILLFDQQNTCISILVILQIISVTIMATKFPFRVRIVNLVMLWTEIAITFAIILLAIIVVLDYVRYIQQLSSSESYIQTTTRNIDGWCIIGIILIVMISRCFFIPFEAYSLIHQKYRVNLEEKTEEKTLPEDYGLVEMVK